MNNPLNQAKKHAYLLLLLPAMFISVSVVLIPAIQTVFNSMTNWNGFAAKKEFIGLANYIELFSDRYFKIAYPQHNLDRTRAQIQLASDMISKLDDMNRIVSRIRCQ